MLEAEYPQLAFDWDGIAQTAAVQAETERWRERRRAERAERDARMAAGADTQSPGDLVVEGAAQDAPQGSGLPTRRGRRRRHRDRSRPS